MRECNYAFKLSSAYKFDICLVIIKQLPMQNINLLKCSSEIS